MYLLIKSVNSNEYDKLLYVISCRSEEMKTDFLKHCEKVELVKVGPIYNDQAGGKTSILSLMLKRLFPPKRFLKTLLDNEIDILHINSSVFPHIQKFIKENSNIKIVTHVREMIPRYGLGLVQQYMISRIYRYSDAVIAISDNEAQYFIGHANLTIIPNPFDFSKIDQIKSTFRADNQFPADVVSVGMMGQFHKAKGHMDFLKALKIIIEGKESKFPFLFVLIGIYPEVSFLKLLLKRMLFKNDYRSEVLDYIKGNGLEKYVKIVPYSYRIFNILNAMDIMVRPSCAGDPWGRDIIESMAFGKPVVATGDSEYLVKEGVTGYLVPRQLPERLAEKILDLINNPQKRKVFGENGKERVLGMCDLSKYGSKIMKVYRNL